MRLKSVVQARQRSLLFRCRLDNVNLARQYIGMKKSIFVIISIFLALPGALGAQIVAVSIPPAPTPPSGPMVIGWSAGAARCDGVVEPFALQMPVYGSYTWISSNQKLQQPLSLIFRIGTDGRPLGIKQNESLYLPSSEDIEPAFTASRFKPGAARNHCVIAYTLNATPIEKAPIDDLIAITVFPHGESLPSDIFDRIAGPGSDCIPTPQALLRAFPRLRDIDQAPGSRDWTMTRFDINSRGKPVAAHIVATTGNGQLDRASLAAVAASRFEGGVRHGCIYPYRRVGGTLAAPPMPDDAPANDPIACPVEAVWTGPLAKNFPEYFRRRAIEGWAIVRYDVAPWGATGNVKILASEPDDQFGTSARQLIEGGRKPISDRGYSGCISRVRYKLPLPGQAVTIHASEPVATPPPF